MATLTSHFDNFFKRHGLIRENYSYLLAISGGLDSTALCDLCHQAGLHFALAHCNFKLRGEHSEGDEAAVKALAQSYNVKVFTHAFDTQAYAEKHGISIQMAARALRYKWFEKLRHRENYSFLLTAHHLQDSLETILINLGRGTGFAGLKGINSSPHVLRPLEMAGKEEILNYARARDLPWREDHTNREDDYLRNFIRHHVLPSYFRAFDRSAKGFHNSINNLQSDLRFFDHQLREKLDQLLIKKPDCEKISIPALMEVAGYPSLLHHWLSRYGDFDLRAIIRALEGESGKKFSSGKYRLLKDRENLILSRSSKQEEEEYLIEENDIRIEEPLRMEFGSGSILNFEQKSNRRLAQLDRERLTFPLSLRKWRKGDSFQPLGMKGRKKLSDYFVDRKFSLLDKERVWLLCSGEDIVWIVGERIDDRYKIRDNTKTVYFARLNEMLI